MKRWIAIVWIVFVAGNLTGQTDTAMVDTSFAQTYTDDFIEHIFFNKTKFELRLSQDKTLLKNGIDGKFVTLRIGVRLKKHYKFGLMMFGMEPIAFITANLPDVYRYDVEFNGIGGYFEYVILKNYRLEVSVPFSIASTRGEAWAFDSFGHRLPQYDTLTSKFAVMGIGGYAAYSLNYWFAVSGGLGYRFSFSPNSVDNNAIGQPYYSFGLKIQIGKLYKTLVHHDQVLYMKSVYFRERKPKKSERMRKRSMEIYYKKKARKDARLKNKEMRKKNE